MPIYVLSVHTRKSRADPCQILSQAGSLEIAVLKTDLEEAPALHHLLALLTSQRLGTFPWGPQDWAGAGAEEPSSLGSGD